MRSVKVVITCVGLIALLMTAPGAVAEEELTAYALVNADSCLNVREAPGLNRAVVIRLDRGDAVTVLEQRTDGWAYVERAGDYGYCRMEYLTDEPPEEPEVYVTSAGKVNLRALPGGKALRKLKKGMTVTVLGWITDTDGVRWARLADGYVMADFLEPEDTGGQTDETADGVHGGNE